MLFIWGSHGERRTFSKTEDCYCRNCDKDQPCTVVLTYTVRHFWLIMRWTTGKAYHAVCNVCHTVAERLNTKKFEARLKKNPVPFFDRLGWLVTSDAVACLIPFVIVYEDYDKKNDIALLEAPRVGDLYEINFGPSGDSTCPDCSYGTALVSRIDDKIVYVHLSKKVYNKISGMSDFATSPKARLPEEYLEKTDAIPKYKLIEMREKGEMLDVIRL